LDTLFSKSCECIRQNWNEYSKVISSSSPYFQLLWNDWCQKFNINDNRNILSLKKFILNNQASQFIIMELSKIERKELHLLCDKIGLYHKSYGNKKERIIVIYKPDIWLWEFTGPSPETIKLNKKKQKYI